MGSIATATQKAAKKAVQGVVRKLTESPRRMVVASSSFPPGQCFCCGCRVKSDGGTGLYCCRKPRCVQKAADYL